MEAKTAVAKILKAEGVEHLLCFPNNALIEAAAVEGIRPICARTERVAVNIADGLSRVASSRRIGVVAVRIRERTVAVAVHTGNETLVDTAIAVVVDVVAQLGEARGHRHRVIVAIEGRHDKVAVGVRVTRVALPVAVQVNLTWVGLKRTVVAIQALNETVAIAVHLRRKQNAVAVVVQTVADFDHAREPHRIEVRAVRAGQAGLRR